ncbi:FecR family protein [Arthrospiribacter ruber]|uniref:FecR family protein n=1 Tax=Arthrospiribacter ruber TaxID=2487934 RepID=A0A951IYE0_9BACT|nr:FecR family protein [Arthrospiribacter ruber]MBW3469500.1 FecR family protein [Arthrospiribacter ruber]
MQFRYEDFEKFQKGLMEKQEAERFLNWINSPEGEQAAQVWIEKEWENFDHKDGATDQKITKIRSLPTPFKWKNIAATVLILLSAVAVFYFNSQSTPPVEYQLSEIPKEITRTSPKGKKLKVTLSDGSTVHLNSESSISYKSNFNESRVLELTGEAFFEVMSDSTRPFKVITRDIATVALGTSFNINAYEEKEEILISLSSGKIKIEDTEDNSKESFFVQPGQSIGYAHKDRILRNKDIAIEKAIQWKSGILEFEDKPLEEVLFTLERWYGVSFSTIKGKIPYHKCSGKFKPNEYLDNVLEALSHSIEFEYTIENKDVKLNFK